MHGRIEPFSCIITMLFRRKDNIQPVNMLSFVLTLSALVSLYKPVPVSASDTLSTDLNTQLG